MARRRRKRTLAAPRIMQETYGATPKQFIAGRRNAMKMATKHCPWIGRKIAEARRDHLPIGSLQPLFRHMLNLAIDAAENGNCKAAGREIGQAKALARRHGYDRRQDDE